MVREATGAQPEYFQDNGFNIQNWNYRNPRKAVHISKTLFQCFYCLVF